jgi:hypothetical protein
MQDLLSMKDMYCYVGDLLGFKNTIMNLGNDEQKTRVRDWTKFIDESIKKFDNITNYQLISDTIFIGAESSKSGLESLINLAKYLLEEGINKSFLLRGAITFGEVDWDDPRIAFGKSIVEAYNLANNQNWIGTSCGEKLPHINSLWHFDRVFVYPVPMKRGAIRLWPAVSWKIPITEGLCRAATDRGLTFKGEVLNWESYGYKIQNTRLFSMYLEKIKALEERDRPYTADPSQYYGTMTTTLLEIDMINIKLTKHIEESKK